MRRFIAASLALPVTMAGLPAGAEITADDVWANGQALAEASGGRQVATLNRSGDTVTVRDDITTWSLPMGAGSISYALSSYTMTEAADGTVRITYALPFFLALSATIPGEGTASITFSISGDELVTIAAGVPGAISYDTETGPLEIRLDTLDVPGGFDATVEMVLETDRTLTQTRIVEDTLTVVYSRMETGHTTARFYLEDGTGLVSETEIMGAPSVTTVNLGLEPGGSDLLNLAPALRNGLYVSVESETGGSDTQSLTTVDQQVIDRQSTFSGPATTRIALNDAGLMVEADIDGLAVNLEQPDVLPFPIGFDLSKISAGFLIPLLASTEAQPFTYALDLADLRLGPSIWTLFDPDKSLPRTPGRLAIDLEGQVINGVDWLNFLALEDLDYVGPLPFSLEAFTLNELTVSALDAIVTGSAAFRFDNADTTTYPDFPKPIGIADFTLQGINGVLEMMSDAGFIPSDALFGARMGLGMVTKAAPGDDNLTSAIELTEDGQIIANGQRLR